MNYFKQTFKSTSHRYYSTFLNKFFVKRFHVIQYSPFIPTFTYQTNLDYWMTIKTWSLLFLSQKIYYLNFSEHFVNVKLTSFVCLVKTAAGWNTAAKTTTAVLWMKTLLSTQLLCFHSCPDTFCVLHTWVTSNLPQNATYAPVGQTAPSSIQSVLHDTAPHWLSEEGNRTLQQVTVTIKVSDGQKSVSTTFPKCRCLQTSCPTGSDVIWSRWWWWWPWTGVDVARAFPSSRKSWMPNLDKDNTLLKGCSTTRDIQHTGHITDGE